VLGTELRPGLWRWTADHEEWKREVAGHALESDEEFVLVDPLLVGEQWVELEAAVDERQVHVVLTIHWHARSAAEIAKRLPNVRVWAHSRNRAAVARRAPVTDVFGVGSELPGGLLALEARPRSEVLFWAPRPKVLIAGDALLGDGERGEDLHTCPASWLPQSSSLDDLRAALRPALELPVELVLTSHGAPVLIDAKRELHRVLADERQAHSEAVN
jgi:glyoxylase-like metal-dependent hydrolase (beta-lactamase superfamily II)